MKTDFRIGETVICIAAGYLEQGAQGTIPSLRLNMEYIIHNIKFCSCGRTKLDVGLALPNSNFVRCLCGHRTAPIDNTHWCESVRFVKKEAKSNLKLIEKQLTKALLDEDYEKAVILRDRILELKHENE